MKFNTDIDLKPEHIQDLIKLGILPPKLKTAVDKGEDITLRQILESDPEMAQAFLSLAGERLKSNLERR